MRALALALALCSTSAHAYFGYFEPILLRNEATITFVDTQIPNLECVAADETAMAPVSILAMGCFVYRTDTLYAPISPSVWWAIGLTQALVTPNALLGHEFSHAFRGNFHPSVLPFIDYGWLRKSKDNIGRGLPGDKHD